MGIVLRGPRNRFIFKRNDFTSERDRFTPAPEGPQKASKDDTQGKKRPRDNDAQDGPRRRRVQWKKYGAKVLKRKSAVDANSVVYR